MIRQSSRVPVGDILERNGWPVRPVLSSPLLSPLQLEVLVEETADVDEGLGNLVWGKLKEQMRCERLRTDASGKDGDIEGRRTDFVPGGPSSGSGSVRSGRGCGYRGRLRRWSRSSGFYLVIGWP